MVASYLGGPGLFFGNVRLYKGWNTAWRDDNLVEGAEISLKADAKDWTMRTGNSGRFEVRGLSPGEYRLAISKPGLSAEVESKDRYREYEAPGKIVIPQRGCVEVPVILRPDTTVSGTVRSVDGSPVAGIPVGAYEQDAKSRRQSVRSAITGEDGRYEIPRLLAGRYIVGVGAEPGTNGPYPTTFHPAASTDTGAMPVVVADGKRVEGIDIVVPPKQSEVTVRIRVLWPDKRPVDFALIAVDHPQNGWVNSYNPKNRRAGFTDSNGFASIELREGTEYTISATWQKMEPQPGNVIGRAVASHQTNRLKLIGAAGAELTLTLNEQPEPR
ncbi:MAG: carboxypeptidase regulatory-like domain-containing protein [Bryobacterales bacterium]|nr:carboxypeptidase regulatory-like domain-containing protein [Bryobacterales bacterium]